MTKTFTFISIPILAGLLLVAAIPVLIPPIPLQFPPSSAPAAEDWEKLGLYDMTHSDSDHNPYLPGSVAEVIVQEITTTWPGRPDGDDWLCATIKLAEKVVRTVYWHKVGPGYGDLAWFNNQAGKWGGAYDYKDAESVLRLPKSLQNKGYSIQSGCGGPPPFSPAH